MINFTHYLDQAILHAISRGVAVTISSTMPFSPRPTPVRGAFRMGEVVISRKNPEEALFVVLHGLGHMAQWSLKPDEHEKSYYYNEKDCSWGKRELKGIWDHEWDALPYVLGFIEEYNLHDIRDWYIRYFIADQYYLADILKNNSYDLQKFQVYLGQIEVGPADAYSAKPFPKLDIHLAKQDYICVV